MKLSDLENNRLFHFQLRFNEKEDTYKGELDYVTLSSKYNDVWNRTYCRFPMDLEDDLDMTILIQVTEYHYEVLINGVKLTESMVNNRENVEYFKTKTLRAYYGSGPNFIFKTAVHMIEIGKLSF